MDKGRMVVPCLSFPFKKMKELEKHVPLVGSNPWPRINSSLTHGPFGPGLLGLCHDPASPSSMKYIIILGRGVDINKNIFEVS
jgi:hypothetical protein